MYQIGVDIGGTNIKLGLVDERLEITARGVIPFVPNGGEQVARDLAAAISDLLTRAGVGQEQVESIGIVIPGSIDPSGEMILNAYNLGFHDVPFRGLVQAHFPQIPVRMANDADGAALAELYKGAFVGQKTAVLLTLGTGLGGGIILNGKMFRGGRGYGTEPGHGYLIHGGQPCTCGNEGCMESYCSATALAREGAAEMQAHPESLLAEKSGGDASRVDARLVTDCARAGDVAANAAFDRYLDWLSGAIATFCNIMDPEVIAIGGGLSGAGAFLFDRLDALVGKKCFFAAHGAIVPAVMGNDAGVIGAAMLDRDAQL